MSCFVRESVAVSGRVSLERCLVRKSLAVSGREVFVRVTVRCSGPESMKTLDVDSMATVQSRLCVLFLDRTSLSGVLSVKSLGFSGQ